MKIEGIITDKYLANYPVVLDTYLLMEVIYSSNIADTASKLNAYATNLNGSVKLYLKEMPTFNDVFEYFLIKRKFIFGQNKELDICLSLFFNPYFEEFYKKIKSSYKTVPKLQIKYLKKNLLNVLTGPIYFNILSDRCFNNVASYNYIKDNKIYEKSAELLNLL